MDEIALLSKEEEGEGRIGEGLAVDWVKRGAMRMAECCRRDFRRRLLC